MKAETREDTAWYARGDEWSLLSDCPESERSLYFETLFTISNGYMGIRGYREEMDNRTESFREGYLAGVFGKLSETARRLVIQRFEWDSRQMLSLPQLMNALVTLDGETFNPFDGACEVYERSLSLKTGVYSRRVVWRSTLGKRTELHFERFASAAEPGLLVHSIRVIPLNWSGRVELTCEYNFLEDSIFRCGDPAKAHIACRMLEEARFSTVGKTVVGGHAQIIGTPNALAISSAIADTGIQNYYEKTGLIHQSVRVDLKAGEPHQFLRCHGIATTRDGRDGGLMEQSMAVAKGAIQRGYKLLLEDHRQMWSDRWRQTDIKIKGNAEDQIRVRFSIFSLLQVFPWHTDKQSIPARCYAWNRYNGLYFWDGEIFLFPFYQMCLGEQSRNLLSFRCGTLEGARRNASMLGRKGALFPWQGDSDDGLEQAPWQLEQYLWHQNAAIVYAIDQYVRATGDVSFIQDQCLQVLLETARFWVSSLEKDGENKWHLNGAVGPDEAEEHGPNNGYTSLMAKRSLQVSAHWWKTFLRSEAGIQVANLLGLTEEEVEHWERVAHGIYIPDVPGCPGVPLQDAFLLKRKEVDISKMTVADFWKCRGEVQVIKQADVVLAMYLLEDWFSESAVRRAYEFYEPRTLHVSSLSYNTHSIVAASIGLEDSAYSYFQKAAGLDLDDVRGATRDGLHAAAQGGIWQMVVCGFVGLRVREDRLVLNPALPRAWDSVDIPLAYKGYRLRLTIEGTTCRLDVENTGRNTFPALVEVWGTEHSLERGGRTFEADSNRVVAVSE